ncbi:MAG: PEP-CTERM sorting domain-containing protein [Fimbriimonadaceae bacterium]|nr:PEP-CTERM sorting domain-containing protein [Fimbriimonadaceae bacterium]
MNKLGAVAMVVTLSGIAVARPELNAFINKPANSIPELIAQIKADKQVADRFMRHFSMTKQEVVEFVSSLRLGTISKSGYYTIYSAPDNGILKAHVSFFKKGTPAFVDSDGNAVLRVKCANPFVVGKAPGITAKANIQDTITTANEMAITAGIVSAPNSEIEASIPAVPEISEDLTDGSLALGVVPTPPVTSSSGFLGSLLGVGGAVSVMNKPPEPDPVPEPTSMVALSLGALALLRKKKKTA